MSGSGALALDHPLVSDLLTRSRFPEAGSVVTCAVSGGPDSSALLVLAIAAGCHPTAVHVDHGLRPESADEADQVLALAARLGAACRTERVDVEDGPNLEARARAARLAVLPADVLTGHTADDRAESMILNLLRGAGPAGMAGMARSPRRPLLDLRRHQTLALCDALGLDPVWDRSNQDRRFARNRVRHEVLPLLADVAERDPVPILVRQADLFETLAAGTTTTAADLDPTDVRVLRDAEPAIAGAAVQAWLRTEGVGDGYVVDAASVGRVLAVARGEGVATEVTGGWRVARSHGVLSVSPPGSCKDADHG